MSYQWAQSAFGLMRDITSGSKEADVKSCRPNETNETNENIWKSLPTQTDNKILYLFGGDNLKDYDGIFPN